jgi:DNA-binding response OmpR family regulator
VRTFALVLEREGLSVLGVADADEALQAVAEHDPAMVLLDPALPGFDGELPRALGAGGATIVLLEGDVIAPPYAPSRIVELVRAALAGD